MAVLIRVALLAVLGLVAAGCSLVAPFDFEVDLTGADGGRIDAGRFDAGTADGGTADTAMADAGPTDAGPSDVGCPSPVDDWIDPFEGTLDGATWTAEAVGATVDQGTSTLRLTARVGATPGSRAQVTTEGVRGFDFRGRTVVLDFVAAPADATVYANFKMMLGDGRWVSVEQIGDEVQGWLHVPGMPAMEMATTALPALSAGQFRVSHGCSGDVSFYIDPIGAEPSTRLGGIVLGSTDVSAVAFALELYVVTTTTVEHVFEIDTIQL